MLTPAKINLYLHVTGRRADGYHLLDTLITFTDICDEIDIIPARNFSITISGEFASGIATDAGNIITQAWQLMQQESGKTDNIAVQLVKNIPSGAGLGGGSSDAAATLILLNKMWQCGFDTEKLAAIGLKLGADVPVFIHNHAAFVSGIGEKITKAENLPQLYAILAYPRLPLATKKVFLEFAANYGKNNYEHAAQITAMPHNAANWLDFLHSKSNHLQDVAEYFVPEIKQLIASLAALPGCHFARISGSGSACFAIFTNKSEASIAYKNLKENYPGYWLKIAKLIPKHDK